MNKILWTLSLILGLYSLQAEEYNAVYKPCVDDQYGNCCYKDTECEWGDFSIGADWLYWKTEQTGLNFANDITIENSGANVTSRTLKPKFKYDSGYRVFCDYVTQDGLWKFCASYSHIPSDAKRNFSSGLFTEFASIINTNIPFLGLLSGTSLNSLDAKWHSTVNYFDFDVSRTFNLCSNLNIMPHIGLRVLWMHQKLSLNATSIPEIGPGLITFNSHLKGKFTGVGLEGGLKGIWQIYDGLSLVGHVGGSVLYSDFHNSGSLHAGTDDVDQFTASYRDKNYKGIPTFDSFIGLQYVTCVYGYQTNIHAGWEQHVIYQTNEFALTDSGSTTLQGLTLGAGITF
jgi:hypothetical protein